MAAPRLSKCRHGLATAQSRQRCATCTPRAGPWTPIYWAPRSRSALSNRSSAPPFPPPDPMAALSDHTSKKGGLRSFEWIARDLDSGQVQGSRISATLGGDRAGHDRIQPLADATSISPDDADRSRPAEAIGDTKQLLHDCSPGTDVARKRKSPLARGAFAGRRSSGSDAGGYAGVLSLLIGPEDEHDAAAVAAEILNVDRFAHTNQASAAFAFAWLGRRRLVGVVIDQL